MKRVRILSAILFFIVLAGSEPTWADGWSWLHPFSSQPEQPKIPRPLKPYIRTQEAPQSTLQKMGTGTKNFFTGMGHTLGMTKPEPKPPMTAYTHFTGVTPSIKPVAAATTSSWNPFHHNDPPKPMTASDFFGSHTVKTSTD